MRGAGRAFFDVDRGIAADPHADLGVFEDEDPDSGEIVVHFIGRALSISLVALAALVGAGEEEGVCR